VNGFIPLKLLLSEVVVASGYHLEDNIASVSCAFPSFWSGSWIMFVKSVAAADTLQTHCRHTAYWQCSTKLQVSKHVSFAEYSLFYRALLQNRPIIRYWSFSSGVLHWEYTLIMLVKALQCVCSVLAVRCSVQQMYPFVWRQCRIDKITGLFCRI